MEILIRSSVVDPQIESLPTNYRSHEEIIKFNNDFFTSTSPFLNSPMYEMLFAKGNEQKFNQLKNGFVQLTFIKENDENSINELYTHQVLKTIHEVIEKGFS